MTTQNPTVIDPSDSVPRDDEAEPLDLDAPEPEPDEDIGDDGEGQR